MMKVKLKVKNIIVIVLSLLFIITILVPLLTLEIAYFLEGKKSNKAEVFYNAYLSKPIKFREDEALYRLASYLTDGLSKYTIMMTGWGGESRATVEDFEKSRDILKELLDKSNNSRYYPLAYGKMMDIDIAMQDVNGLLKWINWGKESTSEEIRYISDIYEAFYHFVNREYDSARDILDRYNENDEIVDSRYYLVKGYIASFEGDMDLAQEYYEKAERNKIYDTVFGNRVPRNREWWLEEYIKDFKGENKIRGKVSFDGMPMPFVEIYIQKKGGGIRVGGMDFVGITDVNGEFETLGLRDGGYALGIGLNGALLYDKVYLMKDARYVDLDGELDFDYEFTSPIDIIYPKNTYTVEEDRFTIEWEPVRGADHYDIQTIAHSDPARKEGGMIFYTIWSGSKYDELASSKIELDLKELRKSIGSIMYRDGEGEVINPQSILGNFYPGVEYPLIVNAYDKDRNLVGSSRPTNFYFDQMPLVKIEGKLTEGEKLIFDCKYEKAIEYYEDLLNKEPDNEEALIYLAKIYMIGWQEGEANYDKALEYATRYHELTGDDYLLYEIVDLMDHRSKVKNQDRVWQILNDIPMEKREVDYYYNLGKFMVSIGQYKDAIDAFENMDDFLPNDMIFLDLYIGNFNKALERLDDRRFMPERMNKILLRRYIEGLNIDDLETEDYRAFKELIREITYTGLSISEEMKIYNKINPTITNIYIRGILDQLKLENYWDHEY